MKKYLTTLALAFLSTTMAFAGNNDSEDMLLVIGIILAVLFALAIGIGLYVLVAVLAQRYNRSVVIWLLLSFVASPLLILIILLCIGKAGEKEIY